MNKKIVLASSSPRRKELLEKAGIAFEIITHAVDETFDATLDPETAVIQIALRKALAVKDKVPHDQLIIAADTIVLIDGQVIGKPANRQDAIGILTRLQHNTHQVITGVAILQGENKEYFAETTDVTFYPLTQEQIAFYVDQYWPYDKAGAYAIQEWIGIAGVKLIHGDFYNVMGLPVSRLLQYLLKIGYKATLQKLSF